MKSLNVLRAFVVPSLCVMTACGGPEIDDDLLGGAKKPGRDEPLKAGTNDGNRVCPAGYKALKVEPPGGGTFEGGGLRVVVSNYTSTQFDWSSNVGVDLVLVKGGPVTNVFMGNEMRSGTAYPSDNPNSGKRYGISHFIFCFDDGDTPPPPPPPSCPEGTMPLTIQNPQNGSYSAGGLTVDISNMSMSSFDWTANHGIDMLVVSDASGSNVTTMHEIPAGTGTSPGSGPITEVTFCWDDDIIRLCGDNYACPAGMTAFEITPADGYYTDGTLKLWVSSFDGDSFHWNSTIGIDAILLLSPTDSCNYWHPEASSGDATMMDGSTITHVTFCYDQP